MVDRFYEGKNILITGCTGFVGKVLLEKILYSLPQVNKVYIFIRRKKGSSVFERFQKEILDSPCFDRVKRLYPNFDSFIVPKLRPVSGDMLKPSLDLSPEDFSEVSQNVNIIINSAASVDFNQRLDQALQINTWGTLRVVELAKSCPFLTAFVQISTAYVNCDKEGWIQEKIYPYSGNPREVLKDLMSIPVEIIEKQTPRILGKYPNTYTYTKHLTEQILLCEASDLPLCIVRPTIIGGSWKEPYPGWVDSVSAAGVFYLSVGLGLMKITLGNGNNIGDQIPVDTVCNSVILSAAFLCTRGKIQVVHIGTSARNPVVWNTCNEIISGYWNRYPSEKAMSRCEFSLTENITKYKTIRFLRRQLPGMLLSSIAKVSRNQTLIKNSQKITKLLQREAMVSEVFSHFTTHEWIFESQHVIDMIKMMTPKELEVFDVDITRLDWRIYLSNYAQGLKKYILKEKVESPDEHQNMDLISEFKHYDRFSDIKWAYNNGKFLKTRGLTEMKSLILNAPRVKKAIEEYIAQKPGLLQKEANAKAVEIINTMISDLKTPVVRMFAWFLRKLWRCVYEKVVINHSQLQELANFIKSSKTPVIILPSHRSYIDFLIVSYIFFTYGIQVPYIAAADDFLQILLINKLFRASGAFFIKRGRTTDDLYTSILTEYMQQLLKDHQLVEFFIEGTRSRSGKTLPPKQGLLSMCTELYFQNTVQDIHLLPITINYERVMEGETFPLELLGEEKVRESLTRIINSVKILTINFGKIHVALGDLVSLKDFSKASGLDPVNNAIDRVTVNSNLALEVVLRLQENMAIMPSTLLSAVLLMHRRGVSEDELIKKVEWLRDEVRFRGFKTAGIDGGNASTAVRNALSHLDSVVRHKKDLFEPSVSMESDYQNILMLSYYRNSLHYIFALESIVAVALFSFGEKIAWGQGVLKERLLEEVQFLIELLEGEYLVRENLRSPEVISKAIETMKKRGFIEEIDEKFRIIRTGELGITFLCSLIWPTLDTYWMVITFCIGIRYREAFTFKKIIDSVQWFSQNLFEDRSINYYESCSQDNIKNSVNHFIKMKVLERSNQKIIFSEEFLKNEAKCEELLEHINNFRKTSLVKMINQHNNLKRALLPEFPEMPKI
jgi:glycerone phosphate O-acyltransferase/fatty acyl-CoA reductase